MVTRALTTMTLLLALLPGGAPAIQVVLDATADTYLRGGAANANSGDAPFLRVNSSPNRPLVRFGQAQIASATAGHVLVAAHLELYVTASHHWGPGRRVTVQRLTADWSEGGATWNCPIDTAPGNSSPDCAAPWSGGTTAPVTDAVVQTDAMVNQYASWDVTGDVAAFLGGTANFGWMIRKDLENESGSADYASRDAAANRPRLVLDLVAPTSTATATATRTATATATPTVTVTDTPTHTPTATVTQTAASTPTRTATATPNPQCPAQPLAGCKQPRAARTSLLLITDTGDDRDALVWRWAKGEATARADFGDPVSGTTMYALCIYGAVGGMAQLAAQALVPGGGTCGGKPCWAANGKGFAYTDHAATAGGIKKIRLTSGAAGSARIIVKGGGAGLDTPALPLDQDPQVIVQLANTHQGGRCWESRFSPPAAGNDAKHFQDRGDAPVATPTPSGIATRTAIASPPPADPTATVTPPRTATDTPLGAPPSATTAPTRSPTSTFTATGTPGGATCGNRILEPGETCASCAADCAAGPCNSPGAPTAAFRVNLVAPPGFQPTTATVLLSYDSTKLNIPGTGTATAVRQRVVAPPPVPQAFTANDLDYAVQVLESRNIPLGQLCTVTFDRCAGAPAPTVADLACTVLSCAQGGGGVSGCTCVVSLP
jgi:hypothetical protein